MAAGRPLGCRLHGEVGVEENTGKVFIASDQVLAPTVLASANGPASSPGSALFVINLCASMAPLANIGKSLPGLDSYRLYQVARREDGRTRHRLRLGFFTSEADAEAVLNSVRDAYPTAFTACLCDEDRKFTRGFVTDVVTPTALPKSLLTIVDTKPEPKPAASAPVASQLATPPAADKAAARVRTTTPPSATLQSRAVTPSATKTDIVDKAAAARTPPFEIELSWDPPEREVAPRKDAPGKDTIAAPSKLIQTIELSLESERAQPIQEAAKAPSSEPFTVARGIDIPVTSLTLQNETAAMAHSTTKPAPAKAPAAQAPLSPAAPVAAKAPAELSKMKAAQATQKPTPPAASTGSAALPDLDSTQTIRALTSAELKDESQEKWFAIQLAISDQPVNLDTMPHLDIFEAYRLYSVANASSGKITHSLRIGFFREEVSAEAVSGYLKTFFASPTVVRISIAEQARFKDPPARKPAAPAPSKGEAKVLDLTQARDRAPKSVPTVTMEVATPKFDGGATGSFRTTATGKHSALSASGVHKAMSASGSHKALESTGTYKAAAKSVTPATKRSTPLTTSKALATGRHKALQPKKSLAQQLLDEAREVELSESGIRKLPKNDSLLSKMLGKLTK